MQKRNYKLSIVLRGSHWLKEDIEELIKDYLRAGGLSSEQILDVLDIRLEEDAPSMRDDLPLVQTADIRAQSVSMGVKKGAK